MSSLLRRDPKTVFPDLVDWFEAPFLTLRPYLAQPIRVEDYMEGNHYTVRAELAGIDPEKDLEVTVGSGYLTIHAERSDQSEGKHRSEFRYGSFTRTLALPDTADEDDVTATYSGGILTLSVGLKEARKESAKKIEVKAAEGTDAAGPRSASAAPGMMPLSLVAPVNHAGQPGPGLGDAGRARAHGLLDLRDRGGSPRTPVDKHRPPGACLAGQRGGRALRQRARRGHQSRDLAIADTARQRDEDIDREQCLGTQVLCPVEMVVHTMEHRPQLRQDPAGHKDHAVAVCPSFRDRGEHIRRRDS
jgi:HSP20 family molecular chaperone IbpA